MFGIVDLAVLDRSGRPTVLAEVTTKRGTSRDWAAKFRRNMLAHGRSYSADFFLIVTPDRLYGWKGAGTAPVETPPTFEAEAQSEFASYFESANVDPHEISGAAFELLVGAWLSDVARSGELGDDTDWLGNSGFLRAVKGGRVKFDAEA